FTLPDPCDAKFLKLVRTSGSLFGTSVGSCFRKVQNALAIKQSSLLFSLLYYTDLDKYDEDLDLIIYTLVIILHSILSKEHQKQLSYKRQKWFRNKNRETTYLSTNTSEELQYLLNTEVPIVVIETGKTPVIDTDFGSDSDNLSPLPNTKVPTITNLEFTNTQSNPSSHYDKTKYYIINRIDQICRYCKAKFWIIEKNQNSKHAALKFPLCCANGKVQLPPLLKPLLYLLNLYTLTNFDVVEFRKHARDYNNALACISFGANIDNQFLGYSISNFRIHSQSLQNMLDICNPYIQNFHQIRDIIRDNAITEISMIIHSNRNQDIRHYNALSAPNIAAIM
ncbi:18366_t:CDS:2, partial [Dentiscutata erythropus]